SLWYPTCLLTVIVHTLINSKLQVGNYGAPSFFTMLGNNLWFEAIQLLNEYKMTEELSWRKHIAPSRHPIYYWAHVIALRYALRRYKPLSLPLGPPLVEMPFGFLEGFKVTVIRRSEEADFLRL